MQCDMRQVELQTLQCVRMHSNPWQDGASMSNVLVHCQLVRLFCEDCSVLHMYKQQLTL